MNIPAGRITATAIVRFALVILALMVSGCASGPGTDVSSPVLRPVAEADAPVVVTFIQLNDIYEITPVSGGRWGGPTRVATVRKQLVEKNPNTFTILAGDLFSPSALGTARVDGERLAGRQMVAVLNVMGVDYATFGNHEFDLSEEQFLSRMEESEFQWVATNVTDDEGNLFPRTERHLILTVPGNDGGTVRIGFIGL